MHPSNQANKQAHEGFNKAVLLHQIRQLCHFFVAVMRRIGLIAPLITFWLIVLCLYGNDSFSHYKAMPAGELVGLIKFALHFAVPYSFVRQLLIHFRKGKTSRLF